MSVQQKDPCLALVYAESGMGKTADTIYAFPKGLFIAAPGALNSAVGLVGVDMPHRVEAQHLGHALKIIEDNKDKGYPAIILDDLSLLAQRTVLAMEEQGIKNYDLWGKLLKWILKVADACRYSAKAHFIMSAHIQPPHDVRGEYVKGGPMIQGKGAAVIPKHCDLALRAIKNEDRLIWPVVYQCNNSDASYTTKDRNNVCADETPMNLAEIMRASGYNVPRIFDWQEALVEKLAGVLQGKSKEETLEMLRAAKAQIQDKYTKNDLHIAWTFRDAIDRAVIRATRNTPLRRLGI